MRYAILLLLAAALPACTETDPMTRPYSWQPTGANALNIAAQVRNKNDLLIGRGSSRSDSVAITPSSAWRVSSPMSRSVRLIVFAEP